MKKIILSAFLLLTVKSHGALTNATGVRVNGTTGVIVSPANFFAANSNELNAAISRNGSQLTNLQASAITGTLTNNTTGNAAGATNLYGTIMPSQIVSNGTYIANGVLSTNSGRVSGGFLTETGTNRAYSLNAGSLTNLTGSQVVGAVPLASAVSGTLTNNTTGNAAGATNLYGGIAAGSGITVTTNNGSFTISATGSSSSGIAANSGSGTNLTLYALNSSTPTVAALRIVPTNILSAWNANATKVWSITAPISNNAAGHWGEFRNIITIATNSYGDTLGDMTYNVGFNQAGDAAGNSNFGPTATNMPSWAKQMETSWQNYAGLTQMEDWWEWSGPYTANATNTSWRYFGANLVWNTTTKRYASSDGGFHMDTFYLGGAFQKLSDDGGYGFRVQSPNAGSGNKNVTIVGDLTLVSNSVTAGSIVMGKGGSLTIQGSGVANTNYATLSINSSKELTVGDATTINGVNIMPGGANPAVNIGNSGLNNLIRIYGQNIYLDTSGGYPATAVLRNGGTFGWFTSGNTKSVRATTYGQGYDGHLLFYTGNTTNIGVIFDTLQFVRMYSADGTRPALELVKTASTQQTNFFEVKSTTSVVQAGVNSNYVYFANNGFASYATNNTLTVSATGVTNTTGALYQLYGVTGVSMTLTNFTRVYGIALGTITAPINYVLQPGDALLGSSMAASGGRAL